MADVNVNQQPSPPSSSSSSWILALLVLIVLAVVLWFVLGRPGGRNRTDINVDVDVPSQQEGGGGAPGGNTGR